jgi:hypothetical protein
MHAHECVTACRVCLNQHLGDAGMKRCLQLCVDCIDICAACAGICAGKSDYTGKISQICAEICRACDKECDKFDSDVLSYLFFLNLLNS